MLYDASVVPSFKTLPRNMSFVSWGEIPAAAATWVRRCSTRVDSEAGRETEKDSPVVFLIPIVMLMTMRGKRSTFPARRLLILKEATLRWRCYGSTAKAGGREVTTAETWSSAARGLHSHRTNWIPVILP